MPRADSLPPLTEEQARRRKEYIAKLERSTNWKFKSVPDNFEYRWEMTITPESVLVYTDVAEDFNHWYETKSPFGKPIVPPFYLSRECRHCFDPLGPGVGRVHVSHETELLEPVFVGTTVRFIAKVTRKYVKRGRSYIDVDIDIINTATDKIVAREKRAVIAEYREKENVSS